MKIRLGSLAVFAILFSPIAAMGEDKLDVNAPSWGILFIDVPESLPAEKDEKPVRLPTRKGVLVLDVVKGGPADKAGIGKLDVIILVAGQPVEDAAAMRAAIKAAGVKETPVVMQKVNAAGKHLRWQRRGLKITPITIGQSIKLQIVSEKDEATGYTITRHRETTNVVNDESGIDVELVDTNKGVALRTRIKYVGDEMLGIQSYTILADDARFAIDAKPFEVKFDSDLHKRWEWFYTSVGLPDEKSELMKALRAVIKAKSAKIIYQGHNYRGEHEIGLAERQRIAMILALVDLAMPNEK